MRKLQKIRYVLDFLRYKFVTNFLHLSIIMSMVKGFFLVVSLGILLGFALVEAAPKESLITGLPGFHGTFASKHYSG